MLKSLPAEHGAPLPRPPRVRFEQVAHIPGKRGLPILGTLPEALLNPLAFGLRMLDQFGPVHRFYASGHWCVQMIGARANEFVLTDREEQFSSFYGWEPVLSPYFAGGLLLMDLDTHRKHHRLIRPVFRPAALTASLATFSSLVSARLPQWTKSTNNWHAKMSALLRDNAAAVFMALPPGPQAEAIESAFSSLRSCTTAILPASFPGTKAARALRARERLLAMLEAEVEVRRGKNSTDLLSRLSNIEIDGTYLCKPAVAMHMVFVLAAAHDTMLATLCALAWFLSKSAAVQADLAGELSGFDATENEQCATPLADSVIKECMRLHPPAPILWRRALADLRFDGVLIPRGTMVAINPLVSHRDPNAFPDPHRFDAHRFRSGDRAPADRWAYIPFGGGPHACLGLHYSNALTKMLLGRVLEGYRFSINERYQPSWNYWPYVHPRGGLPVDLKPA